MDPYILVHERVVPITPERVGLDMKHPHRGFANLWYAVSGSSSTGHSTCPGGAMERAQLETGSLLKLRTGRLVEPVHFHIGAMNQSKDQLADERSGKDTFDRQLGTSIPSRPACRRCRGTWPRSDISPSNA